MARRRLTGVPGAGEHAGVSDAPASLSPLDGYSFADLVDELRRRTTGLFVVAIPTQQPGNGSLNVTHRFHFLNGGCGMALLGAVQIQQHRLAAAFNAVATPATPPRDDA